MRERTVIWDDLVNLIIPAGVSTNDLAVAIEDFCEQYPHWYLVQSYVSEEEESLVMVFSETPNTY